MVTVGVAARLCTDLPDVTEGVRFGNRTWFVRDKSFAWLRPLTRLISSASAVTAERREKYVARSSYP
jgi:hypothetical protein